MIKKYSVLIAAIVLIVSLFVSSAEAAGKPTYTISPSSKTYAGRMMNYSTYNSYTRHYYLLRSYLEQLEKTGGGTLVLKAGTYTISNTLYVPSDVTLRFKDGARINKGNKTGTSRFSASKSIFQLVRPTRSGKQGVYGKYNGEKNISFIGEGTATIDLKNFKDSIAIIAGHNQNVKIENLRFQNMYSGHFIEMDATYQAVIRNNRFTYSLASSGKNKEAINLDTPDRATLGWSQKWSTFDKTPNKNVRIEGNYFYKLDRAIGTHKYSEGKYHDAVVIRNNTINNMRTDSIRVMNWSNAVIENNKFNNVAGGSGTYRAILASGAHNPTFRYNTIESIARPMQFMPWKNIGAGSAYNVTYNKVSSTNKEALKTNKAIRTTETFIRINTKHNIFTNPIKVYLK